MYKYCRLKTTSRQKGITDNCQIMYGNKDINKKQSLKN